MVLTNGQQPLYAACGNTQAQWPSGGGPGGGEPPAWARAGSVADIDFVNDPPRAWTSTGAEVAWADFDEIFGESELIAQRVFDPLMLDSGVGYGQGTGDPGGGTMLGALITAFNFNFTAVIEFDGNFSLEYTEPAFATDLVINAGIAGFGETVTVSDANGGVPSIQRPDFSGADASSKLAVTVTADAMYAAYNGESLDDGDVPPNTAVNPATPNQPTDIVFQASKLKRLTVYNPIKTQAEQRALTA